MTQASETGNTDSNLSDRIKKLRQDIRNLCGGKVIYKSPSAFPAEVQEMDLEDILAFENVGKGPSLFEGLQENGLALPHPAKLDESECRRKAEEIMLALAELRVFLLGFQGMTARELYRILWHQTLWEGCYVKKRYPGSVTLIDVSHKMSRREIQRQMERLMRAGTIH